MSTFAYFTLDIRSNDIDFLEKYSNEIITLLNKVKDDNNVNVRIEQIASGPPLPLKKLDKSLQMIAEKACEELGIKSIYLHSGAGHDVAVVGNQTNSSGKIPVCLLFIPCKDGISHNPEEFTTNENIANGASVLAKMLLKLAI